MAYYRPKPPKGWTCTDVKWFIQGRKKPIAFSSESTMRTILVLGEKDCTFEELYKKINYDIEAKKVIQEYIKKGYGKEITNKHFR